ncbi:MAG: shikimate dehydrogenase [Candidatus Omnitrophica bacterium]|nr:shikimate dehydrogenase [Candidatus Omnitrophota bacterium]MBU3934053.1 shikimate dehydrogenase [Candidatus Omnitrophota bacterium]
MKIYGLIGFPVKHSYSAVMHNAAFKELGVDARYELFEVKPGELEARFKGLVGQGVCGFNITVPYKEEIINFLDELDREAHLIGAVNTVKVNEDKTTKGFNTDGPGFITHLTRIVGFNLQGKKVSILGAGGAARAVSTQLAKNGAGSIALFDMDRDKAKGLAAKLEANFSNCDIGLVSEADALLQDKPDLLINATPVGMYKEDRLVFNPEYLHPKLVVYDLVYNPAQTPLLREAKRKGCSGVFNGLGMLLYQGALAFKVWLDVEPPVAVMEQALREVLVKA